MSFRSRSLREASLLKRWKEIEALEYDDENVSEQEFSRCKESWFVEAFSFFQELPLEEHCWCGHHDIAWPLLEPFYSYYHVSENNSAKALWRRFSQELRKCTRCVLQYYKAKELYATEFVEDIVGALLAVLQTMDEERVATHLHEILCKMKSISWDSEKTSEEIICVLFEVMRFPILLEDAEIASSFVDFLQFVENTFDLSLAADQCYAGIYALLFHNDQATRRIALRLAGGFGKLRTAADLEPIQPVLQKHMHCLEFDLFDFKKTTHAKLISDKDLQTHGEPPSSSMIKSRPRTRYSREALWIGLKTLLGMLEPATFEEGVVERYPFFLGIVLNHASEASPVFWNALHCLKLLLNVLGYKLWIKTTVSPGVMRSTLIGQCFHTREEKIHKAIFDLFQPFLQSLEALEDGEYERQRRNILYFLIQQVGHSRNFSNLMIKKARQISFFIILRGFKMDPACPPMECVHMWGPALLDCAKDTQLYESLRQPALQLLETILIADSVVLSCLHCMGHSKSKSSLLYEMFEQVEEVTERRSCKYVSYLKEHKALDKLGDSCDNWFCAPILWVEILEKVLPSDLPESFSQAILWASSRLCSVFFSELETKEMQSYQHEKWESINAMVSPSLAWETPKGCDDGGDGRPCSNSMLVQVHDTKLVLLLKRSLGTFVGQIQLRRVNGSWIWDPYLAEVLALLCYDSYEKTRDVGRYILAHFAQNSSLDSGQIFLCSSQASAECVFSGLFYAIKLLIMSALQETVTYLQNLLFMSRKIITFWQVEPCNSSKNWNVSAVSGDEGGFLKQPDYDLQSNDSVMTNSSDLKREENLQQTCGILWPLILKVMKDGYPLAEDSAYLTLFTRLFDLLPLVLPNILEYNVEPEGLKDLVQKTFFESEFCWISSFLRWGDVSNVSIHRRWKLAVSAILTSLRKENHLEESEAMREVFNWLETGTSLQLQLKDKLKGLLNMALSRPSNDGKHDYSKAEPSIIEAMSDESQKPTLDDVNEAVVPRFQDVIVLSDDEAECLPTDNQPATNILTESALSKAFQSGPKPHKPQTSPSRKHVHPISLQKSLRGANNVHGKKGALDRFLSSSRGKSLENSPTGRTPLLNVLSNADGKESSKKASWTVAHVNAADCNNSVTHKSSELVIEEKPTQSTSHLCISEQTQKDHLDMTLKEIVQSEPIKPTENLKSLHVAPRKGLGLATKPQFKRQLIQLHDPNEPSKGNITRPEFAGRAPAARLNDWYKRILTLDYFSMVGISLNMDTEATLGEPLLKVPLVFRSSQHYMDVFRPLVLEEFRAQLQQSYDQLNSTDETTSGILRLMSLEKVDDFDFGRFASDAGADGLARSSFENDLLLLSRQPLSSCNKQSVHVIGKVERQERDNKSHSIIIILKFYLRSGNKRLAKVCTLLLERSKWYAVRLISITPQLREFQALSAVEYLPLLPIILNDGSYKIEYSNTETSSKQLIQGVPEKLEQRLRMEYNASQIQSIQMALRSAVVANGHELSLIQGPPGTGKTRTILAIISALISSSRNSNGSNDIPRSGTLINAIRPVSKNVAIARSWQAAALAKQEMQLEELESVRKTGEKKSRILVCAQSNAAVDELVYRICKDGLYESSGGSFRPFIVRVGNAKNVRPNCLPVFIETLVDNRLETDKENAGSSTLNRSSTDLVRKKFHKILEDIQVLEAKLSKLQTTDTQSKIAISRDSVSGTDDSEEDLKLKVNMLYKQRRQAYAELAALEAGEKRSLEEAKKRRLEIKRDIIRQAEIVVATLSGCGGDVYSACIDKSGKRRQLRHLDDGLFDAVVIDEAAQALEPTTLIPLQLLKTSRAKCIMVGDPKQLPATVISQIASKFSFKCSLFERLQKGGLPVSLLTVQYRMHPEICEFPSAYFYENQLEDGKCLQEERKAVFHEDKHLGPYVVFDVADGYEKVGHQSSSQSLCNEAEVEMILEMVRNLGARYPNEVHPGRIGIITPYQQQLSLLHERCRRYLGQIVVQGIEFNTVDGYQGREVDILIFSAVRATNRNVQNSSKIGFVADVRRMNVALTRARFSLWIVCNAATLQASAPWAALLENAKDRGLLHRVKSPYKKFFERGFRDQRKQVTIDRLESPMSTTSNSIISKVEKAGAKKESVRSFVPHVSANLPGRSERGDFSRKAVKDASKVVSVSSNQILSKGMNKDEGGGSLSRRDRQPEHDSQREKSKLDQLDHEQLMHAETNQAHGNCHSKKSSEIFSQSKSNRERGGEHSLFKTLNEERHCSPLDDKTMNDVSRLKHTDPGKQTSNRDCQEHVAGVTNDKLKILEPKQTQSLKTAFEEMDTRESLISASKCVGGEIQPTFGKIDTDARSGTNLGAAQYVTSNKEAVSNRDHGFVNDGSRVSPPECFCEPPQDVQLDPNFKRPFKRSRHVTPAGQASSSDTQGSTENTSNVQVPADKDCAVFVPRGEDHLNEEWNLFCKILSKSKICFPLP